MWKNKAFIKLKDETDEAYEDINVKYGVMVARGGYEKLLEYPALKSFIKWEDRRKDGTEYLISPETMKQNEKTVSLPLVLIGETEADYYEKYEAFMQRITSGMVYLKIVSLNRVFKVVYSGISNLTKKGKNCSTFTIKFIEPNPKDRE